MKKLLIVVDFQNDFVTGSLGFKKAEELEDKIYNKISEYKKNNDEVIFTFDTHDLNYENTREGKVIPTKHCLRGTSGWSLYGKIDDVWEMQDMAFEKNTFGSLDLANYLKGKEYESVELVGVVTNLCVLANAILVMSALPETEIFVDAECTAAYEEELTQRAFDVLNDLNIGVANRKKA